MYGFFLGTLAKSGNSTEGNGVVLLKRHRWKLPLFWRLLSLCSKPPLNEEGNEEGAREGSGTRRSILDRNLRFRLPSLPIPLQWRPLGNLSIFLFLNVYWISEVVELIELRILNFECRWKWWMTREQCYTEWSNRSWTSFFLLGILTGENRFLCHLQHGTMKRRRYFICSGFFMFWISCSVNEGYLRYTQFRALQHFSSAALSVLSTQVFSSYPQSGSVLEIIIEIGIGLVTFCSAQERDFSLVYC